MPKSQKKRNSQKKKARAKNRTPSTKVKTSKERPDITPNWMKHHHDKSEVLAPDGKFVYNSSLDEIEKLHDGTLGSEEERFTHKLPTITEPPKWAIDLIRSTTNQKSEAQCVGTSDYHCWVEYIDDDGEKCILDPSTSHPDWHSIRKIHAADGHNLYVEWSEIAQITQLKYINDVGDGETSSLTIKDPFLCRRLYFEGCRDYGNCSTLAMAAHHLIKGSRFVIGSLGFNRKISEDEYFEYGGVLNKTYEASACAYVPQDSNVCDGNAGVYFEDECLTPLYDENDYWWTGGTRPPQMPNGMSATSVKNQYIKELEACS